ncbi:HupE/UreJ family protein [Nocardia sp. NPDC050697]|uniref:HupE/UreJ family protein n=1 Tax=Nocardia sp. NPDC050697 TaxID=3155158 RepID=UPI0033D6C7B0
MRRLVLALAAVAAVLLSPTATAAAHPMPHSTLELDPAADRITARLSVPTDDLALASGIELRDTEGLRRYLTEHLRLFAPDGRPWSAVVGELRLTAAESTATGPYREVLAEATLTPPPGAPLRRFTLAADPVVHRVVTHSILVSERAGGQLGVIAVDTRSMRVTTLPVDLDGGGPWRGFAAMFRLGGDHILAGTDHLLFLLVLLLPAPLLAADGRWRGPIGTRRAVGRMTAITLAFTAGHSATLALAALGRGALPAGPVESLIAVSILIGAVHALRPLFPGREAVVAAGFGLVHGLAFSATLAELQLSTPELVTGLLGFNLGIELMQLLVVALVLPCLLVLAHTRWYTPVRVAGALCAAVAALGWLLDRLGVGNPVAVAADRIGATGWYSLAGLVVLAGIAAVVAPRADRSAPVPARASAPPGAPPAPE